MYKRKRKVAEPVLGLDSEAKNPSKRAKNKYHTNAGLAATDQDICTWATDNGIALSQSKILARLYTTVEQLLNSSGSQLKRQTKLSKRTIDLLLQAQKSRLKIAHVPYIDEVDHTIDPMDQVIIAEERKTNTTNTSANEINDLLNTKQFTTKDAVLNWLQNVVNTSRSAKITDVLHTTGATFPYRVPDITKELIYRAAVKSRVAVNNVVELHVPFVSGAPGTGKTRMLLESLNILKECASTAKPQDDREKNFIEIMDSDTNFLLYTSFGSGFGLTTNDKYFWECEDCSGVIALRVLWRYYLYPITKVHFSEIAVTSAMAQYLTLDTLIKQLQKVGVKYIVLAMDEMNMLWTARPKDWTRLMASIGNMMTEHYQHMFVLFGGTIHAPVKAAISDQLGTPVSISPCLFTLADINHILVELSKSCQYLVGWQHSHVFRKCVADMSNPPRVFDFLMMEIEEQCKRHDGANVNTLQYDSFIGKTMEKIVNNMSSGLGVSSKDVKAVIEYSITKKVVQLESKLPSGKTIEEATRQGNAYVAQLHENGVIVSVPFIHLWSWLRNDTLVGGAAHMLNFAWNDAHAIGPGAWEAFQVKYIAFKLTLLTNEEANTIPLCIFHSGAVFGGDCAKYSVKPRFTEPVKHSPQFPNSFDGQMNTDCMSSMTEQSCQPKSYMETVCLNDNDNNGIDAFYWLSDKVIEFQQYSINDNSPTLTQQALDEAYDKAKNLFTKYLLPHGYDFIFGLITNQSVAANMTLKPNMYVVHNGNMEEYYGPSFAAVAQIKCLSH